LNFDTYTKLIRETIPDQPASVALVVFNRIVLWKYFQYNSSRHLFQIIVEQSTDKKVDSTLKEADQLSETVNEKGQSGLIFQSRNDLKYFFEPQKRPNWPYGEFHRARPGLE
jgi:hypothetical protein